MAVTTRWYGVPVKNVFAGFGTPKAGADGANVLVKISASTSNCEANIDGYDV